MGKRQQKSTNVEEKPTPEGERAQFSAISGSSDRAFQNQVLDQVMGSLWLPPGASHDARLAIVEAAVAALEAIAPRNELEGMLAVQMVSTHNAAMDCLRRAILSEQTFEGRDLNLRHAAKLLSIYTRQLEVLDKHRGKGQQKITVEHVNVHAGGQAIVGNVSSGGEPPAASQSSVLPTLKHQPEPAMPDLILEQGPKTKGKAPTR